MEEYGRQAHSRLYTIVYVVEGVGIGFGIGTKEYCREELW